MRRNVDALRVTDRILAAHIPNTDSLSLEHRHAHKRDRIVATIFICFAISLLWFRLVRLLLLQASFDVAILVPIFVWPSFLHNVEKVS